MFKILAHAGHVSQHHKILSYVVSACDTSRVEFAFCIILHNAIPTQVERGREGPMTASQQSSLHGLVIEFFSVVPKDFIE